MCSVQGCDSWRRGAECFGLPEDPQMRLQWIQFVSETKNELISSHLKESSCSNITVCREHFLEQCFEKPAKTHCMVRLKSSAVPTVRIKEEAVDTTQQVLCKTESSIEHSPCIQLGLLHQDEEKSLVNNNVSELFPNTCPSCNNNLQTTTINEKTSITLTQQCLTCQYSNEFRREISASANEHQTTGSLEVIMKEEQTDEYICESDTFGPIKDECGDLKEEERDSVASSDDLAKELLPEKNSDEKIQGNKLVLDQQVCSESEAQRTESRQVQKSFSSENGLPQFFPHKCPLWSNIKLQTEKVAVATLITLTQQCHQCEYKNEFTRQTCASTTEHQSSTLCIKPVQPNELNSETFAVYKEESGVLTEEDSDEDWFPISKPVRTKEKTIESCIQLGVLQKDEEKPLVNNTVAALFPNTCPSCSYNLQTTTINEGTFITLTQQCPRCAYRVEFREISKSANEHKTSTGSQQVIKEEQTNKFICESDTSSPIEDECGEFKEEEKSDSATTSDDLARELLSEKDSEEKSHGPYDCKVCGKSCTNNESLKRHVHIHDENYEYQCIYCHATFKKKTEKLLHQQIHYDSPKPYECLLCPETFPCRYERSYHLKTRHANRKQTKCKICGFTFENRHYLQRHMVIHTGDKPYKCSICERAFNQAGHLRSHMRLHTGERPYKCQHCDKAFNHNVSLKSHMQRYHKPDQ